MSPPKHFRLLSHSYHLIPIPNISNGYYVDWCNWSTAYTGVVPCGKSHLIQQNGASLFGTLSAPLFPDFLNNNSLTQGLLAELEQQAIITQTSPPLNCRRNKILWLCGYSLRYWAQQSYEKRDFDQWAIPKPYHSTQTGQEFLVFSAFRFLVTRELRLGWPDQCYNSWSDLYPKRRRWNTWVHNYLISFTTNILSSVWHGIFAKEDSRRSTPDTRCLTNWDVV